MFNLPRGFLRRVLPSRGPDFFRFSVRRLGAESPLSAWLVLWISTVYYP